MSNEPSTLPPPDWDGPDWASLTTSQRMGFRRKIVFLRAFATTGIIKTGLDAAGVSRDLVTSHWRKDCEWFKRKFVEAEQEAADLIEAEYVRRAVQGVDEPVIYQGQPTLITDPETGEPRLFTVKKYSDSLMTNLMKARRPETFGDKSKVTVDGQVGPVLVVPGTQTMDEWIKATEAAQAKYAGNQGEDSNEQ